MSIVAATLQLLLLHASAALAAAPAHRVVLHGGLTGLLGPSSVSSSVTARHGEGGGSAYTAEGWTQGAGVLGRLTLHGERAALEAGAREALASQDTRSVGAIFFGVRFTPPPPVHLRLGFAHHHETPLDILQAQPVASILGTASDIRHRSGLEVGVGTAGGLPRALPLPAGLRERGGLGADLSLSWLPDHAGPHVYVSLDLTGSLGVGGLL